MTASELIDKLQMCPKDATVMLWNSDTCTYDGRITVGITSDFHGGPLEGKEIVVLDMNC